MQRQDHKFDCLICGSPLVYKDGEEQMKCMICGNTFSSNCACEQGHYICDKCHSQPGMVVITAEVLRTQSKDPFAIAMKIMDDPHIHMHGPEHHYLVPAVLLAAYYNAGGRIGERTLADVVEVARLRASQVPGGICGFWGCCGAAVGAGIFTSLISGATPLAEESWGECNAVTAKCLELIAKGGGPRCCKRDCFLALAVMRKYLAEHYDVQLEKPERIVCHYVQYNRDCQEKKCPFYQV